MVMMKMAILWDILMLMAFIGHTLVKVLMDVTIGWEIKRILLPNDRFPYGTTRGV